LDTPLSYFSIPLTEPVFRARRRISMGVASGSSRSVRRSSVLVLAAIPVVDAVINQINTIYQLMIGPFSMLQVTRGSLLVVLIALAVVNGRPPDRVGRTIGRVVLTVTMCLTLFVIREFSVRGELFLSTLVPCIQIVYCLVIWYVAACLIRDSRSGTAVLEGLMLGAVLTAASVYYGYATGVSIAPYSPTTAASAGFFVSGKGIAGTLDAAALIAAYFSYRRHIWSFMAIALVCLGASFFTYARAGLVALAAALTWLAIWSVWTRVKSQSSWVRRLLLAIVCGVGVLICTIGTGDFVRRWSDLQNPETAGSGRLVLWNAAFQRFYEGSPSEQLIGCGFQSMYELTYSLVGVSIHTHNDVVDMLFVGGIIGLLALALVYAGVVVQIRSSHISAPEAATAVAILVVLLYQGFFTGQLLLPDVMANYFLGITAVMACRSLTPALYASGNFINSKNRRYGRIPFSGDRRIPSSSVK
jgi:O-Antigen ligase